MQEKSMHFYHDKNTNPRKWTNIELCRKFIIALFCIVVNQFLPLYVLRADMMGIAPYHADYMLAQLGSPSRRRPKLRDPEKLK